MHLQALRPGRIGGMETYVRQLVRRLPELAPDVELVLFGADHNAHTFRTGSSREVQVLSDAEFASLDSARLRAANLDVWFCPLLVLEPREPGLPSVVTIPDMQHEALPHFFRAELLEWRREHYARSATRADAVLTLSRFSRQQIIETLEVDPETVHAIHLDAAPWAGAGENGTPDGTTVADVRIRHQLPDEFLLYPANNWPHKNHATLFRARRLAQAALGHPVPLVLIGAEVEGTEPWAEVITDADRADGVRHLGYVPEADLPGLFALSRALVFPSLFEGFGMPVLEAMRAGCPVVCSSLPSLREICGDTARYVDPNSVEDMASGIQDLLQDDEDRRRATVEKGLQRAATFSWTHTAQATLDVFRSVATPAVISASSDPGDPLPLFSVVTPSLVTQPAHEQDGRALPGASRECPSLRGFERSGIDPEWHHATAVDERSQQS